MTIDKFQIPPSNIAGVTKRMILISATQDIYVMYYAIWNTIYMYDVIFQIINYFRLINLIIARSQHTTVRRFGSIGVVIAILLTVPLLGCSVRFLYIR